MTVNEPPLEPIPEEPAPDRREDRPLTALFGDLASETAALIRKEAELAKAEMSEKASQAMRGAISLAAGGAIALIGLVFLLWAAVYALALWLPTWAAALIVGLVVAIVGLVMLQSGRSKLSAENLQPKRTIETLKDDSRWAKAQIQR